MFVYEDDCVFFKVLIWMMLLVLFNFGNVIGEWKVCYLSVILVDFFFKENLNFEENVYFSVLCVYIFRVWIVWIFWVWKWLWIDDKICFINFSWSWMYGWGMLFLILMVSNLIII